MRLSIGRRFLGVWVGISFRPGGRKKRRRTARQRVGAVYYTHPGCYTHHKRQDAAEACARRMRRAA